MSATETDAKANKFDGKFLIRGYFTIPVDLEDHGEDGEVIKRRVLVTYQFDDDLQETLRAGKDDTVKRPIPPERLVEGGPIEEDATEHRELTDPELLQLLIRTVSGIEEITQDTFKKMPPKYKKGILQAVMKDIYPDPPTSVG